MNARTATLALLLAASCGGDGAPSSGSARAGTRTTTLGWLGAHAAPLVSALDVEVDGRVRTPGGLVLTALAEDGPLERAGARPGDVLVRAGEEWVPLSDDPTFPFIGAVELGISAGAERIALGVWRDGALIEVTVPLERPALEVGLPVEVERFREGARAAVERLLAWQREAGGWPGGDAASELAVDALAGLALHSAGASGLLPPERVAPALDRAAARAEALAAVGAADDPLGLALAVALLAERIGPLPPELLLAAGPRVVSFGGPVELPDGGQVTGGVMILGGPDGELPDLSALEGLDFEVVTMTSGGEPPEGVTLPEGLELPAGAEPGSGAHDLSASAPEPADLGALLAEHDPDRVGELERLSEVVDALLAAQAEDGGWGESRLVPTAFALVALGAAQRVGLELADEPVERGCALLRELVHDGKVAAAVARGADRRDEAGRAAAAALAFLALGCPETDPFVRALLRYSDEAGAYLLEASDELPFHLLATALLRRRGGIGSWARFYEEFRLPLVAWQRPDGAFEVPLGRDDAASAESAPAFDTALGALLCELQSARVPALLGLAENPLAPTIDGE